MDCGNADVKMLLNGMGIMTLWRRVETGKIHGDDVGIGTVHFAVILSRLIAKETTTWTTFDNKRTLNQQAVMHVLLVHITELAYACATACGLNLCKRRAIDYRLHVNNTPGQAGLSFHAAR